MLEEFNKYFSSVEPEREGRGNKRMENREKERKEEEDNGWGIKRNTKGQTTKSNEQP